MFKLLILLFSSTAYAQLMFNGDCNFSNIVTRFNTTSMLGRWYQLERINNSIETGDCSSKTFTLLVQNDVFQLEVTDVEVAEGNLVLRKGISTFNTTYLGVFNMTYNDGNSYNFVFIPTKSYGYKNAVIYGCKNNDENQRLVWGWKLSRFLNTNANNKTDQIIAANEDLFNATWRKTSFSESACKVNSAVNLYITPIFILLTVSAVV